MRCEILRRLLSLACAAVLPLACAAKGRDAPHPGIASLWNDFLEMPPERAVAIAGNPDRQWVGAAAGGHASQIEAEQAALAECRKRRAARRIQAACRLYASGEEILRDKGADPVDPDEVEGANSAPDRGAKSPP